MRAIPVTGPAASSWVEDIELPAGPPLESGVLTSVPLPAEPTEEDEFPLQSTDLPGGEFSRDDLVRDLAGLDPQERARFLREWGIGPADVPGFYELLGTGPSAGLLRAVWGGGADDLNRALDYEAKLTHAISLPLFESLYSAASFAISKGWVPNVALTITWNRAGVDGFAEVNRIFKQLRDAYLHWCQQQGLDCVHYWTIENGPKYGLHSHMGIWLPVAWKSRFRRWLKDWLLRCMRRRGLPVATGRRDLPHRTLRLSVRKNGLLLSHWRWFCHCTQGVDGRALSLLEWEMESGVASRNRVDHRERLGRLLYRRSRTLPVKRSGSLPIKRAGVSDLIGHEARRVAGFASVFPTALSRAAWVVDDDNEVAPERAPTERLLQAIKSPKQVSGCRIIFRNKVFMSNPGQTYHDFSAELIRTGWIPPD